MKNKINIAAMTEEEREEYMLNCAVYKRLARNMMHTAYDVMDDDNCWVFGCSYFPNSAFLCAEDYAELANTNKETITLVTNMEFEIDSTPLIFDETIVDMTRPFAVQTTLIARGNKSKFFTVIQYLD